MSSELNPVSHPWRRFLRFSVRGLIVAVLLIGGWLGWIVRSARIQREAVAAITQAGCQVQYDWEWEWNGGVQIRSGKPWGPQWLVDRIGVDYFGHVTLVAFYGLGTVSEKSWCKLGVSPNSGVCFSRMRPLTTGDWLIWRD